MTAHYACRDCYQGLVVSGHKEGWLFSRANTRIPQNRSNCSPERNLIDLKNVSVYEEEIGIFATPNVHTDAKMTKRMVLVVTAPSWNTIVSGMVASLPIF
jgi:hypothetical protein